MNIEKEIVAYISECKDVNIAVGESVRESVWYSMNSYVFSSVNDSIFSAVYAACDFARAITANEINEYEY